MNTMTYNLVCLMSRGVSKDYKHAPCFIKQTAVHQCKPQKDEHKLRLNIYNNTGISCALFNRNYIFYVLFINYSTDK